MALGCRPCRRSWHGTRGFGRSAHAAALLGSVAATPLGYRSEVCGREGATREERTGEDGERAWVEGDGESCAGVGLRRGGSSGCPEPGAVCVFAKHACWYVTLGSICTSSDLTHDREREGKGRSGSF